MADVQEPLIDAQLAALVECSTDAIVSLTLDGTMTSWNRAAERLYQYRASEALGQHSSLVVPLELLPEFDDLMARKSAHMVEDRTKHLARLVEQILDVSRLDQSRLQLSLEDVDVVGLIRKLVANFVSRHPREFRLHLPDHVRAAVDPVRLEQVMANLIDNGVRYSPGGGPIDISVELENDDWIVLSVRDRGVGIPEEHRVHLFDRFYQAHGVSYRSGMGLGLNISREIAALHGGDITVAFPVDGGSQFKVPLMRSSGPQHGGETAQEELIDGSTHGRDCSAARAVHSRTDLFAVRPESRHPGRRKQLAATGSGASPSAGS